MNGEIVMFKVTAFGDCCLRIQFGKEISPKINQLIRSFSMMLSNEKIDGIVEWIPTYTTLSIIYHPYIISYQALKEEILKLKEKVEKVNVPKASVIYIPTCYEEEYAPDLSNVAEHVGLDEEEVISIHKRNNYLIYMMGFAPGFPYLGGMSKKIATPRLANPRPRIPVGSVGIAETQTGIYPVETPGGWQLIGRTPLQLYDAKSEHPLLLKAGDYIRFTSISKTEYKEIELAVKNNTYEPQIEEL